MSTIESTPYVVGQWVRGTQFYGRRSLIEQILQGTRRNTWVLGNRRVGKTSLLRELERLALEEPSDLTPLYWDLQGSDTPDDLAASLQEAILDGADDELQTGNHPDNIGAVTMLRELRRHLAARGRTLFLLCDEAEALLALAKSEPKFIDTLGSVLRSGNVRCVMASTIRLWSLAAQHPEFLQDLTPPLYLGAMAADEAASLVMQEHLEPDARPRFEPSQIDEILERTGRHPYLLQLLSMKTQILGDLEEATRQLLFDSMVSHFLTVDFEALSPDEQTLVCHLASSPSAAKELSGTRGEPLLRLTNLGFVESTAAGHNVSSIFFRHWLRGIQPAATSAEERPAAERETGLAVGDWSVEPESNLVRRGSEEVRLEPRVMNLLVFLASRQGLVTSKEQIVDAVWEGAFISESALTRTIADLRKALGDDARSPRYVETISKRGYRLVAEVSGEVATAVEGRSRFSLVWNGRPYPLSTREFLLGRDAQNTLVLPSGNVSRRHARIVTTSRNATLEDLGSRNGTRLNGVGITAPRILQDGDEIGVGDETLVFRDDASPSITNVDPRASKEPNR